MYKLDDLINLRRTLHRHPELANREVETSKRISEFLRPLSPHLELNISKTGKAFIFDSQKPGETIAFRCELDALPIQEKAHHAYRSAQDGVAHLCGHDGHMAIICGLADRIAENPPTKGKAVLIFQPAEETDLGAKDVVESPEFNFLAPDYIFALHNIPGVAKNTILLKEGAFAAASRGIKIQLQGYTSHSAEPEKGNSPTTAVMGIISAFNEMVADAKAFHDQVFSTVIYIRLGEEAFGVSPGQSEFGVTLRAFDNDDMNMLCQRAEKIIEAIARQRDLDFSFSYTEIYPATINNSECVEMIGKAAQKLDLPSQMMDKPFRFSEDFAYFTSTVRGAQFGIGSGENQPPLHNPEFDFPDDIIEKAVDMFYEIYAERLL